MISDLTFKEENHTYLYKGAILPSVTQIMQPLSDDIYKHIDPEIMRFAAERGTKVHLATEMWDLYRYEELEEEYKPYLEAYKKFLNDYNPRIISAEQIGYHAQYLYAGTVDRIMEIDRRIVLVDLKTTNELHEGLVAVQVSAYRAMMESQDVYVDDVAVLQLKKDGTYEFRKLENEFDIFLALYKIHMFKKQYK